MVALTITPKHGNHTRYFPHAGFLGLSPVILAGHVHTRLEEDNQPLEASRLVVRIRCYEAVGSTLSKGTRPELPDSFNKLSNLNVLWQTEQTLWAARSSAGYEPLGDSNRPWKLTIPTHAVDPTHNSNAQQSCPAIGSITYKTWRSWWQVETVIYHKPAGIMGSKLMKSHPLYLINYREAEKYYSSPEEPTTTIQSSNSRIRYEYGFLVKLKVPLVKSKSHYSIGETCKTNLATVNFSFQFKLSIKNKVTNRLETIDLSELNVDVFSISKAEIQGALGQLKKISGPLVIDFSPGHTLLTLSQTRPSWPRRRPLSPAPAVSGPFPPALPRPNIGTISHTRMA
ncbi:hypothetical protein PtB15_6B107 [Puccinia triticina]|nr:hypothetical protein PtB15_6B107 [Puccinia triticina]